MDHHEVFALFEQAANGTDFDQVAPLIADDAVYWFTGGSFEGADEVRRGFERTWATIRTETYRIEDCRWVAESDTVAVCVYRFRSRGVVDGQRVEATGRGTNVLVRGPSGWTIVHEHLSADPGE